MQVLRRNPAWSLSVAALLSLVGGLLLHVAADPTSGAGESVLTLLAGLVLLILTGASLYRFSHRGQDVPTEDEVPIPDSGLGRFLRASKLAAPLYLGLRLAMAYEWLSGGWAKLQQPGWTRTGLSLQAFWLHAVTIPKSGTPAITYPAYRGLIQFMLDQHWYTWFGKVVVAGELLIGLGLLFGAFTGIAAFAGLLMNFNFVYAGSTSINPTLIILEAIVLYGWKVAGWYGADRYLLPTLGTPWAPAPQLRPQARRTNRRR